LSGFGKDGNPTEIDSDGELDDAELTCVKSGSNVTVKTMSPGFEPSPSPSRSNLTVTGIRTPLTMMMNRMNSTTKPIPDQVAYRRNTGTRNLTAMMM